MGLMRAPEQLSQILQPSMLRRLSETGIDRILDLERLLDRHRADQKSDPVEEELAIGRCVVQLERIHPRWAARTEHVISSADRADKQLGPAILVEKHQPWAVFARLGEQEIEHHGLTRSCGPDDGEIPKVAGVEVEVVGSSRRGFEQGERLPTVITLGLAGWKIVPAG